MTTESKKLQCKRPDMESKKLHTTHPNKKVSLKLVGLNGNAFFLMGAFQAQAKRQGWSKDEIDAVLLECRSGDYDHLLRTLMSVCEA